MIGQRLYAYPYVGNFGLGHSLLAWARCQVWATCNGVEMLAPSWFHLRGRIGPILRAERDNRQYHRLFRFPDYITGLRRQLILATRPRIIAEEQNLDEVIHRSMSGIVVFSNLISLNEETYFADIIGHGSAVRAALTRMTRVEYLPPHVGEPHIALHVRMGDFSATSVEELRRGVKNSRIPLNWYASMLRGFQEQFGSFKVRIYSDGSDVEIAPLLALPNVARAPRQPSITDLLSIAQARLVISSGSGFSMWGSFLGDVPRICFPGQRFTRVLAKVDGDVDREPECESWEQLPAEFVKALPNWLGVS